MIHRLTDDEMRLVGRCLAASELGHFRPRYAGQDLRMNTILGTAGEIAAARILALPLPAPVERPADLPRYDVGTFQVRTRKRTGYDLMVARDDRYHANDPFILVWWVGGRAFHVVGWRRGVDVMQPRWWTGHAGHPLHGRIPYDCWSMPAGEMLPLDQLTEAAGSRVG